MDEEPAEPMMILPVAAVTQMVIAAYNDGYAKGHEEGVKSVGVALGGQDCSSPFLDRDQP